MKKILLCLLPLFIVLVSCQKEVSDATMQPPGGTTPDDGTYLPLTKGTYWKYQDSATGSFTTLTVLDKTKTINGRLYTAVLTTTDQSADTLYMAQQSHDYFYYADVASSTSSGSFLFHYLNDTASIGQSWQYIAGQGNGFEAQIKTTILERNITRTVHNKTYNNVIRAQMDLYYDILGTLTHATTYDHYVAKGIGFVQIKATFGLLGFSTVTSSDLVEYEIK